MIQGPGFSMSICNSLVPHSLLLFHAVKDVSTHQAFARKYINVNIRPAYLLSSLFPDLLQTSPSFPLGLSLHLPNTLLYHGFRIENTTFAPPYYLSYHSSVCNDAPYWISPWSQYGSEGAQPPPSNGHLYLSASLASRIRRPNASARNRLRPPHGNEP